MLGEPVDYNGRGRAPNRLALAPMTNCQSHDDGTLAEAERAWLESRARDGYGTIITAACYVSREGRGFPSQIGCSDDAHIPGLTDLAEAGRAGGGLAVLQLHHAGLMIPPGLNAETALAPSPMEGNREGNSDIRAMEEADIRRVIAAFAEGAARARRAGFDGVEIHGAHGYLPAAFLSPRTNRRDDAWGGDPERRRRFTREIITAVRHAMGDGIVGLRLSPEGWGLDHHEMMAAAEAFQGEGIDYLHLSLWDYAKQPKREPEAPRPLLESFARLKRPGIPMMAAGGILQGADATRVLEMGADIAAVGSAALVRDDWATRVLADPAFTMAKPPYPRDTFRAAGLTEGFIDYIANLPMGLVAD